MTYNCVNGYIINGESTRVCQASSTWSGSAPTCERTFPTYRVTHYMNTRYLLQLIKFGKINLLSYLVSYSLVLSVPKESFHGYHSSAIYVESHAKFWSNLDH